MGEIVYFAVQFIKAAFVVVVAALLCERDRIQFETLGNRVEAAKYLTDIGALMLDQVLDIFGFPPIGGEEGKRRVQTLNMVNAEKIDEYQLGGKEKDAPKKPENEEKQPEPEEPKEGK